MDELEHLAASTQVHLLRAIEAAAQVHHRGELFLWCQGPMQALVPHGILLCLLLNAQHQVKYLDCLHAVPLGDGVLEQLRDPHHGLVGRVVDYCKGESRHLLLDPQASPDTTEGRAIVERMARLGLGAGLLHSTGPLGDGICSVFVLMGMAQRPLPAQSLLLQVLLPQLHMALARACHFGSGQTAAPQSVLAQLELTERQLEILHWVKLGKTNHETAAIVGISELTVKNHLQRVFRKLDVHNRAQAVARLMALNLE